jgi:TolB-like protein
LLFSFENYTLDSDRRELICDGARRPVEPQVFDVLEFLVRNRDHVVSRDELLANVWNGRVVSDATLASRINAARNAIGDNGEDQRLIRTVSRKGFRFVGDVREQGGSQLRATSETQDRALPDKPSIAVMPFQNMSGDPEQDYFADGIVDDIITGLARIKWLFVIARNSGFAYKGKTIDVKRVGSELGVRYVLEGSVRRADHRVRITAQLVDATTGTHIWADRYDRMLGDIFAVQDELTLSVVGAIEPSLRKAEIERIKRKRPDSLDAYDLVLRALPFLYSSMPGQVAGAIPLLEQALALDPGYARAHADLAWCLHHRFSRGAHRGEDLKAALMHARVAAASAGDDSTTLAIAGLVIALDAHDTTTALNLFDRALALSNCDIYALGCSAIVLAWMGEAELAEERSHRALRLSPFDPQNVRPHCALSVAHFHRRHFREASDAALRAIEFNPGFSTAHALSAAALARLDRLPDAKDAARQVLVLEPTFTIEGFRATVGLAPKIYNEYAQAWSKAGLP